MENLQYELYPPIFTIRKVRNDQAGLTQQTLKDNQKLGPRVVASRGELYQRFLQHAKKAAGIDSRIIADDDLPGKPAALIVVQIQIITLVVEVQGELRSRVQARLFITGALKVDLEGTGSATRPYLGNCLAIRIAKQEENLALGVLARRGRRKARVSLSKQFFHDLFVIRNENDLRP